jgi:hypothetical protein
MEEEKSFFKPWGLPVIKKQPLLTALNYGLSISLIAGRLLFSRAYFLLRLTI